MHEYKTARLIFNFMEFLSWAIVAVGVLIALGGLAAESQSRGIVPIGLTSVLTGFLVCILGLFCVMFVQMGRATVDTAQMTGRMLKISEAQLRIANEQQSFEDQPVARSPSPRVIEPTEKASLDPEKPAIEDPVPKPERPAEKVDPPRDPIVMTQLVRNVIRHDRGDIKHTDDGYYIENKRFETLADARSHLDAIPISKDAKT